MSEYGRNHSSQQTTSVEEAKAKRQAVLARVRQQRKAAYKRTVAEWMHDGVVIRGSELKNRYTKP